MHVCAKRLCPFTSSSVGGGYWLASEVKVRYTADRSTHVPIDQLASERPSGRSSRQQLGLALAPTAGRIYAGPHHELLASQCIPISRCHRDYQPIADENHRRRPNPSSRPSRSGAGAREHVPTISQVPGPNSACTEYYYNNIRAPVRARVRPPAPGSRCEARGASRTASSSFTHVALPAGAGMHVPIRPQLKSCGAIYY